MPLSHLSLESFYQLVEEFSDGVMIIDKDWNIRYANEAAASMLHKPAGYLPGKNAKIEFPHMEQGVFYKAYQEVLETKQRQIIEDYSETTGTWTRAVIYPAGEGIAIYFYDLTAQRRAETEAKKSEENYRTFLDRITDGFIVLDNNFNYIYVNKKIGELVHRDPGELIGKNVWGEFPEAVNSLTYKAFQTAMKEQRFINNIDYYAPLNLLHVPPVQECAHDQNA